MKTYKNTHIHRYHTLYSKNSSSLETSTRSYINHKKKEIRFVHDIYTIKSFKKPEGKDLLKKYLEGNNVLKKKSDKLGWVVDGGVVVSKKPLKFMNKNSKPLNDGLTIVKPIKLTPIKLPPIKKIELNDGLEKSLNSKKEATTSNRKTLWDIRPYCQNTEEDIQQASKTKTLLKIKIPKYDATLDVSYYNYFNNYELRQSVKKAHPHFSLVDLNSYLKSEWEKKPLEMKKEWLTKKIKPTSIEVLEPKADYEEPLDEIGTPVHLEVEKPSMESVKSFFKKWSTISKKEISVKKLQRMVRKWLKIKKLRPEEIVGRWVYCLDKGIECKVLGLYRRKGKQLRYRVIFKNEYCKSELLYRKDFKVLF